MKKLFVIMGTVLLLSLGLAGRSTAGVSIGVSIPVPPLFVFSAPPDLVAIPGTQAYYCPDTDLDLFFYGGYWYRPYSGYWYRSESYSGPWVYIRSAPYVLLHLPHDYRFVARGERGTYYYPGLHSHGWGWDRDRHWEHHHWGRSGRWGGAHHERHFGFAPSFGERGHAGVRGQGGHWGHGRR